MSIDLRSYTPDDDSFLFELYASTRKDEVEAWGWDAGQRQAFLKQQFAAQQHSYSLQFPQAEHSIIVMDNRPVGRMIVAREDQELRLVDIALLGEHRNNGIGTRLIQELIAEAAKVGKPLRLQVLKSNPAARLYSRLGFLPMGDDGLYLHMELPVRASGEV